VRLGRAKPRNRKQSFSVQSDESRDRSPAPSWSTETIARSRGLTLIVAVQLRHWRALGLGEAH
jgi:hypothetical protein